VYQFSGLFTDRSDDTRMAVAKRADSYAHAEIQVFTSRIIAHPHALSLDKREWKAAIGRHDVIVE
jgi:hypothetical protein